MGLNFQFGFQWQYKDKKGSFALLHRPFFAGIRDWTPAFTLIAEDVLQPYVMSMFDTEGASQAATWQRLAAATVKRRGSAHPILQVTGALKESWEKGGRDHVEEIAPRKLTWGSRNILALFHEFGTRGRTNLRRAGARKVMFKTQEAREKFQALAGKGASGVPARPMLIYSRPLANDITSKMRGHALLVARQVGYAVAARPGEEPVSPVEARQIGEQMLKNA